jgi:transcriptional regulator with XRE-family HTH domain
VQVQTPPNRLRELREERGLPRYAISALIERDQSQVFRYEQGLSVLPDPAKRILAAYFGVSVDYLMGWDRDEVAA